MFNKHTNLTSNLGTIKETKMKMSSGNKFPIFEIHHDKFISVINIVCFTDSKTNFKIDSGIPPSGSYEYVSIEIAIKYCDLFNDYKICMQITCVIMFIAFYASITIWM